MKKELLDKLYQILDKVFRRIDRNHIRRTKNIKLIPGSKNRWGGKISYAEWAHVIGIFQTIIYQNMKSKVGNQILDIGCGTELLGISPEPFTYAGGAYTGMFHKGVLLSDNCGLLIQQTENVQVARQIRFTGMHEIEELKSTIKAYIFEAIEVEKAGLKIKLKETTEFQMSEEFQNKLNELPELKAAFERLTPGRQRGYLLHFSQPKQSKTRMSRIEKCMQKILNGEGLNDNYKSKNK